MREEEEEMDRGALAKQAEEAMRHVPEEHRRRGMSAGIGASIGGVVGSLLGGPLGAAVGAGLGGAIGVAVGERTRGDDPP